MIKIKDLDGYVRDDSGNPVVDENGRFLRTGEPMVSLTMPIQDSWYQRP
jgi:hypothetical protein